MNQLGEYETCKDHGHKDSATLPQGYQKIPVHLVFAVKHDARHKARCVADGHLTDTPLDSIYPGVVSLRAVRLVVFLAELNGLETWTTDIDSAYLEAKTQEKVYIIAGCEFDGIKNHILVINRALYGLYSSGLPWHDRFLIVYVRWDSNLAGPNLMFGCVGMVMYMNTLLCMWMT
jgi:hypothetical protein